MVYKFKLLLLPLTTCALLFAAGALNAEDDGSDGSDQYANSSDPLNLEDGAVDQVWSVEECTYNPSHPYCLASAEIPFYPVYGLGSGWGWPSVYRGGIRRTGNPDRRGR